MKLKISILMFFILTFKLLIAHPHVFIDYNLKVNPDGKLYINWTFDPMESGKNLYFFDDDGNGDLSKKEVNNLYNEAFKRIKKFGYFIVVKQGNTNYPIEEIYDFDVVLNDNRQLVYSFNFNIPKVTDKPITVTHFDTTYYVSFSEPKEEIVDLPEGYYFNIEKNRDTPYYYDPSAGAEVVLDTSKPQPGWIKAYPTEVQISSTPIESNYKFSYTIFKEKFTEAQKSIYLMLSEYILKVESGFSLELVIILLLSLLYGIIHAVGPGHRKVVIGSYMLSNGENKYKEGIFLSIMSAIIHSGTGIITVLVLYYVFNAFVEGVELSNNIILNNFSSVVLMVLVIFLIIKKLRPRKKDNIKNSNIRSKRSEKSLILLSSIIPCPGAATIMLVSVSLNMVHIGVLSVLLMSLGIGATLSVISVISIKGKKILLGVKNQAIIKSVIEWCAIAILLIFSITLFSTQGLY